jgi:hypothetical protein
VKQIAEDLIESSYTPESCCERDFRHWHLGFMNELLGEKNAACLRDGNRRCSQVLKEEPPQLALPQTETIRQLFYARAVAIERSIGNESQGARYGVGGSAP